MKMKAKSFETNRKTSISPKGPRINANHPAGSLTDSVLSLQRKIGNQGVGALLARGGISANLRTNHPPGPDEREADQMAGKIVSMAVPDLRPKSGDDDSSRPEPLDESGKSFFPGSSSNPPPGSGQPLSPPIREFFESRFGNDFGRVRIHTDPESAGIARALNARSFTLGKHIVFGRGQYSPDALEGKHLLAHELAHVVQQGQASPLGKTAGETSAARLPPILIRENRPPGIQRSPATLLNLEGKEESGGVQLKPVGSGLSEVCVLGVPIARVYFSDPQEQKINVQIMETSREPGKPPRVQILLDCFPTVRIELLRPGIEQLAQGGVGLQVGTRLVGIEMEWTPESGVPDLPPRKPEVIEVMPPEEKPLAPAPKEPEVPETKAFHEEIAPLRPEKTGAVAVPAPEKEGRSILGDILEKLRTKLERECIKGLLQEAARCMMEGKECRAEMDEAAEIALSILRRKTEALDPRSAKKETVKELLKATEDVMMLGVGEKEAETAMEKSLRWGETQLDLAVKELEKTPTKDKARVVADKACVVMLLGGEPTEALDLLMTLFPPSGERMEASSSGPP
jgi:hypothetical protein